MSQRNKDFWYEKQSRLEEVYKGKKTLILSSSKCSSPLAVAGHVELPWFVCNFHPDDKGQAMSLPTSCPLSSYYCIPKGIFVRSHRPSVPFSSWSLLLNTNVYWHTNLKTSISCWMSLDTGVMTRSDHVRILAITDRKVKRRLDSSQGSAQCYHKRDHLTKIVTVWCNNLVNLFLASIVFKTSCSITTALGSRILWILDNDSYSVVICILAGM